MLSPNVKRKFLKIIPYTVLWFVAGILYCLIEYGILGDSEIYPATGNVYEFKSSIFFVSLVAALLGTLIGFTEEYFLRRILARFSFVAKVITKTLMYLTIIFVILIGSTIPINAFRMGLPVFHQDVIDSVLIFMGNFGLISIMLYIGIFLCFSLFVSEVIDNMGMQAIINFFTGKYNKSKEEQRIFMFLDMKSSTTIAEALGHETYYKLLNSYYADMTSAIVKTEGEIYQYVGDEIVLSWSMPKGIDNGNCLRCFFLIKQELEVKREKYLDQFGVVPEFKAGLHCGVVTTGEVGVIKKEILHTGDVINTAARIQGNCNAQEVDILLSERLLASLELDEEFTTESRGEFELRGKDKKVKLFTVNALH